MLECLHKIAIAAPTLPPPKASPPGVRGLLTALRNPLDYWSEPFFRETHQCIRVLGRTYLTVTDPALTKDLLLDRAELFRKSPLIDAVLTPILGEGLVTAAGEDWRRQRRIVAPIFQPRTVEQFLPLFIKAGDNLADRIEADAPNGRIDIVPPIQRVMLDVILDALFDVQSGEEQRQRIRADVDILAESLGRMGLIDVLGAPFWLSRRRTRAAVAATARMRGLVAEMIRDRRATGLRRTDLLDQLLYAEAPDTAERLPDRLVAENILTFLGAGPETTGMSLVWTLFLLSHSAGLQSVLRAEGQRAATGASHAGIAISELKLHRSVILEALRLYPPIASIGLTPTRPARIAGCPIRPGDHIAIGVYPTNRHEAHWSRPWDFLPDRFLADRALENSFAYLPFGHGRRICVGKSFAVMQLTAMLYRVLQRTEFNPVPGHAVTPRARITLHPIGGLSLRIRSR